MSESPSRRWILRSTFAAIGAGALAVLGLSSSAATARAEETCPRDALQLGVCANALGGMLGGSVGSSPQPCCTLLQGLADLEAAVCLCTALKANILGINLNIPVSLSLLMNECGHEMPEGFQCA